MKHIGIIGSSGGNLRSQGGDDPRAMISEVFSQAAAAGIDVAFVQLVLAQSSMDTATGETSAKLYTLDGDGELMASRPAPLAAINKQAAETDAQIAAAIRAGEVDGLMLLSCDPEGANSAAITAAVELKIPVAGTGGTSMAKVREMGANVIAASGTTGTTSRTRAVSAVSAFAKEWDLKYTPVIGSSKKDVSAHEAEASGASGIMVAVKRISIHGIMMSSMPGFIAMALSLALSKIPGLDMLESDVFEVLVGFLPILVAAIAAKQVSGMDDVGIIAGIVAGGMSTDGGIIGGLCAGIIAGLLVYEISIFCISHGVPGTTTNIAAGGIGGLVAGLIGMYAIAPVALVIGNAIKYVIDLALEFNSVVAGAISGFAIWFAMIGGVYHAAILPIILLEMEEAGFSFLGAIDLVCLVMVSAGIQLAYIIRPRNDGDRPAAIANIIINLGFGTFVEAAYPYMFSSRKVFASTILSATIGGLLVGIFNVKCTAYVPCFVAPFLSNDNVVGTIICLVVTVLVTCALTLVASAGSKGGEEAEEAAE